jgi:hypothetical protein
MGYESRNKMKKNEKKEIKRRLDDLDLEGSVDITLTCLKTVMKNHKKNGYFKFFIEKDTDYEYGCPEGYTTHYLYGVRLETDEEFAKRIATNKVRSKAAKAAAKTKAIKRIERERKQYLRLKAKYEPESA